MPNLIEEESGFFNAEEIENEDGSKSYDRVYIAEQFANYFALFVGNGVFINPVDQLMVSASEEETGLKVQVNPGWAFINGMWYHNTKYAVLELEPNTAVSARKDGIFCRYSKAERSINIVVEKGRIVPKKLEYEYELLLATVTVVSGAIKISNSNITDKRPDESVCGFVKGLVNVIQTEELFQQFTDTFETWLSDLNEMLGEDAAGSLLVSINELKTGKANKSIVENITISPESWTGEVSPFVTTIELEGVQEDSIVDVIVSNQASMDEIKIWMEANVIGGDQSEGSFNLQAMGEKPMEEIPITVIIRG